MARHDHHHGPLDRGRDNRRRLALTLTLAAGYMAAEVVGAWYTGSLALLADAGHMLSDVGALSLALFASWISSRASGQRWTYGLARAEILAALLQGAVLVTVAVLIVSEAIERLGQPPVVFGPAMLAIATGGLIVNLIGLRILERGRHDNLNIRGAWLHVLSDALGSVGAMAAGFAIWRFQWYWADPAASLAISALVLVSAWNLLREAVDVLMEAAPRHLDLQQIETALGGLAGVARVHDLHVWTISGGTACLSCHLVVAEERQAVSLLSEAYLLLGNRFGIDHATVQIEPEDFAGQTPRSLCAGGCEAAEESA
jgi:cobalt-zinc-cadmium efflux system protein